jgi:hypothetical protein
MSKFFINRPIVAMVISIVLVLVGALTIVRLPVAQFPKIAPPEIQILACGTATFMSRTSTCRRHRGPNVWRRTNWSTRFCRRVFCQRQT